MQKSIFRKGLVVGIILIFVGTSINSGVENNNNNNIKINYEYEEIATSPNIYFVKDDVGSSISVASLDGDYDWANVGYWDGSSWSSVPNHSQGTILAGEKIYNEYGIIKLKWIPTDTYLGIWTFNTSNLLLNQDTFNNTGDRVNPEWTYTDGGVICSTSVSSNGAFIVIKTSFNIHLFNKNSNVPLWSKSTGNNMGWVSISADGSYIAATAYNQLRFYNLAGTLLWSYSISGFINCLSMSEDGGNIVIGGYDSKKIYLFNKVSSTPVWVYTTNGEVWSVDISSDSNYIVAGGYDDNKLYFFSKISSTPLWTYTSTSYFSSQSVAISSNGDYLTAGDTNGKIYLFNKTSNIPLWNYVAGQYIRGIAISSSGYFIAVGSGDTNLYLFQKDSSSPYWIFTGATAPYQYIDITPDGNFIAAGSDSNDKRIYYFSRMKNTPLWSYKTGGMIWGVSISANGQYLGGGGVDNKLYFFNYTVVFPEAIFTWTPVLPNLDELITFDASLSNVPDGTIVEYAWDWDNDGIYDESNTTPFATYSWSDANGYPVTLKVTDDNDLFNITTKTVYVGVENPPSIESIIVSGLPLGKYEDNPVTKDESQNGLERVRLEATISQALGYNVTKVTWSGDITDGEGNPYEYEAAEGTQGKKKVKCTITYKNLVTAEIKNDISLETEFNLFFIKNGDDDNDAIPNWFKYWQSDNAVPGLDQCEYDIENEHYGLYYPGGEVVIGSLAATTDNSVTIPPLGDFYAGVGIDLCYAVVAHELKHKEVWHNWNDDDGIWQGWNDSDGDYLPNNFERSYWFQDQEGNWIRFNHNNPDTFNIHEIFNYTAYYFYGDEEVLCRMEERGKIVEAKKDWANPGKQSNPPYDGGDMSMFSFLQMGNRNSNSIINNITEQGIDSDGDGKYNILRVTINLSSNISMSAQVFATLFDNSENKISFIPIYLMIVPGSQEVQLDFDGTMIYNSGGNGPYAINVSLYTIARDPILFNSELFSTAYYNYTDFQPQPAIFNGNIIDQGIDTNGDGFYDNLLLNIGVNVTTPGNYSIGATLYDNTGDIITTTRNTSYLNIGNHTIALSFDGKRLYRHGKNGPYQLRYLGLSGNNQTDFILNAYNTSAYNITDFQKTNARFYGNYTDSGIDNDNNTLYEYLKIQVGVQVDLVGNYTLSGSLYDINGTYVDLTSNKSYLTIENNTMDLFFNGTKIYQHGVSGHYIIGILTLLNENGSVIDTKNDAYTTAYYDYYSFRSNDKPSIPDISGPTVGVFGEETTFSFYSTDPDDDDIYYMINWGDGNTSIWFGPYPSGQAVNISYVWEEIAYYSIKAKTKDIYKGESNWSQDFTIHIIEWPPVPPEIEDNSPNIGFTGEAFTFNATVIDNIHVSSVLVSYWYETGGQITKSMTNVAGDYWEKTIILEHTFNLLYYCIIAIDSSENWNSTETKNVTIIDNVAPEITNTVATPNFQAMGGYVNISTTITDNIEVNQVFLFILYPDQTQSNISITQNKKGDVYYCNTSYYQPGVHTYHIWANDTNNNTNVSTNYIFEINTPPIANDDYTDVLEDSTNNQIDVITNDYDPNGHDLVITNVSQPFHGFSSTDGVFVFYTPEPNYNGDDHFTYIIDDGYNGTATATVFVTIIPVNDPPNKPERPSGPTSGKIGVEYTYSSSTIDIDGDQVYYQWNWGDGTNSGWLGPYNSGVTANASHTWWIKANYSIRVKAKDTSGAESDWSDPLAVTMPYSYNPIYQFFEWLFQRFPNAFPILRHWLGY